jgi:hypothetical protein
MTKKQASSQSKALQEWANRDPHRPVPEAVQHRSRWARSPFVPEADSLAAMVLRDAEYLGDDEPDDDEARSYEWSNEWSYEWWDDDEGPPLHRGPGGDQTARGSRIEKGQLERSEAEGDGARG